MDSPVRHYCTYFDHRYLPQGLALHQSMRAHIGKFRLWVLALDEECEEILRRIRPEGLEVVSLRDLEQADPELRASRQTRSLVEFYFTSTPCLLLHLLNQNPEIKRITYLDADTYFFASPAEVEKQVEASSIAITPHRFRPELEGHRKYGVYNVGWLSFRRDSETMACLGRWREQCLQDCRDEPEAGRFGDQGYLDEWPGRYAGVKVVDRSGFNEAPWNVRVDEISKNGQPVKIGQHPLIFFHFQGLRRISPNLFNPNWHDYAIRPSPILIQAIYQPYLLAIAKAEKNAGLDASGQEFIRGRKSARSGGGRWSLLERLHINIKAARGAYLSLPCR